MRIIRFPRFESSILKFVFLDLVNCHCPSANNGNKKVITARQNDKFAANIAGCLVHVINSRYDYNAARITVFSATLAYGIVTQ